MARYSASGLANGVQYGIQTVVHTLTLEYNRLIVSVGAGIMGRHGSAGNSLEQ